VRVVGRELCGVVDEEFVGGVEGCGVDRWMCGCMGGGLDFTGFAGLFVGGVAMCNNLFFDF
jgi:hypothetical protein